MRRWLTRAGRSTVAAALGLAGTPVTIVSAHPLDELLQLVYVTPAARGIVVEVQVTPGELIAEAFAALVDASGDGTISDKEAVNHRDLLCSAITVRFGEVSVPLRVTKFSYPDASMLSIGGGTIAVWLAADSPPSEAGERVVTVANTYAPMKTVVQCSVTLAADHVVDVTSIQRSDEGRTLQLCYREAALV